MRVLIVVPHYFKGTLETAVNRSTQAGAETEHLRALVASISSLHHALAGRSHMKGSSTRSPDEPVVARTRGRWRHPGEAPHVAEPVIGRAFARSVGSQ